MTRLALLLRGINVGGNNKVPMAELREILTGLGYADPKTLLNSGNAIVTTDDAPDKAEQRVKKAMKSALGLSIETLARTHEDLAAAVKADPFKGIVTNPSYYAVAFLSGEPDQVGKDTLAGIDAEAYEEQWKLIGRELYLWYPSGQAKTKLTGTFWERKLKVTVTARNWNTLVKLRDLTAP